MFVGRIAASSFGFSRYAGPGSRSFYEQVAGERPPAQIIIGFCDFYNDLFDYRLLHRRIGRLATADGAGLVAVEEAMELATGGAGRSITAGRMI